MIIHTRNGLSRPVDYLFRTVLTAGLICLTTVSSGQGIRFFPPPVEIPKVTTPASPVQPPAEAPQVPKTPATAPATASGSVTGIAGYDPALDNRLKAPDSIQGLFGMQIKDVENVLRYYGAKSYSYAFGKYSRMTFSVYMLTLSFDKHRRLGAITIEPRTPFEEVAPAARTFLLQLFLKKADLGMFQTVFEEGRIDITYIGSP